MNLSSYISHASPIDLELPGWIYSVGELKVLEDSDTSLDSVKAIWSKDDFKNLNFSI